MNGAKAITNLTILILYRSRKSRACAAPIASIV